MKEQQLFENVKKKKKSLKKKKLKKKKKNYKEKNNCDNSIKNICGYLMIIFLI